MAEGTLRTEDKQKVESSSLMDINKEELAWVLLSLNRGVCQIKSNVWELNPDGPLHREWAIPTSTQVCGYLGLDISSGIPGTIAEEKPMTSQEELRAERSPTSLKEH